ncbi:MAG TPA: hypothetical protein K8V56_20640 [Sporosarcina psychrophila]|uniref:Uncharacterized protein n=1 Tax=Sporosarcina psychrophila TaxID=1476 RepID=A0A921G3M5_SPOPS|nr:hypothetical protein [Sporosarcina psychrophila]
MKTFKDFLHNDIGIFINTNEFATTLIIEGESVDVLLDDEKMVERQLAKQLELHNEELLFYVEKSKLSFYPRPDNTVRFDNVVWRVLQAQEDEGLLTVTAERVSG